MTTTFVRHYLNSRQLWKHLARKHVGDNKAIATFGCDEAECLKSCPESPEGKMLCVVPQIISYEILTFLLVMTIVVPVPLTVP